MDSLKFPITFNNDGSLTKLAEGSDEYFKQLVSFCLLTEPNSLRLTPDFGVFDITFNKLAPEALAISVNKFIPEIQIKNIINMNSILLCDSCGHPFNTVENFMDLVPVN